MKQVLAQCLYVVKEIGIPKLEPISQNPGHQERVSCPNDSPSNSYPSLRQFGMGSPEGKVQEPGWCIMVVVVKGRYLTHMSPNPFTDAGTNANSLAPKGLSYPLSLVCQLMLILIVVQAKECLEHFDMTLASARQAIRNMYYLLYFPPLLANLFRSLSSSFALALRWRGSITS